MDQTTPESVALSVGMAAMGAREPHTTDNKALPEKEGARASHTVTLARHERRPVSLVE